MMADEKDIKAEDQTEDPSPEVDLEERLSKLEKLASEQARILEEERKASAGKDKKITELAAEKRKLQEATLSKDSLNELRAEELKQKEAEWAEKSAAERLELETLRMEMDKRTVLDSLSGFPSELREYVKGTTPEEIETSARQLMALWTRDRNVSDNSKKVTGVPRTGGTKSAAPIRANDLAAKARSEQREWAASADDDDFLKVVLEQQQGKAQ